MADDRHFSDPPHGLTFALDDEHRRQEIAVSVLAHEIRQPLSTLLAAVEVARLSPESMTHVAEIMTRQIAQMNRLVDDLIDAARWTLGKSVLQTQRLDVRDVVRNAALDASPSVADRGHELEVATGAEPLWTNGDPQRLQQVFSNLLGNAVKYTDPGGRISLSAQQETSRIVVRVRDTGRGIAPEALGHVFDLFSQVRPSESSGLGVGLSVARTIVLLHGGRIEARSEGRGRGSEFVVTLPAEVAPASVNGHRR